MKIQIRKSVFETNSSSVHSISIAKYSHTENDKIVLEARLGEFGWEHELYTEPCEKLSYLWTAVYCLADHEAWGEKQDFVKHAQILEEWKEIISDIFSQYNIEIEYEYKGAFCSSCSSIYYIDHGWELKDMLEAFKNNPNLMVDFVMSENSVVETYNDNSDYDILTPNAEYIYEYTKGN